MPFLYEEGSLDWKYNDQARAGLPVPFLLFSKIRSTQRIRTICMTHLKERSLVQIRFLVHTNSICMPKTNIINYLDTLLLPLTPLYLFHASRASFDYSYRV